jgi:hypothetical protein
MVIMVEHPLAVNIAALFSLSLDGARSGVGERVSASIVSRHFRIEKLTPLAVSKFVKPASAPPSATGAPNRPASRAKSAKGQGRLSVINLLAKRRRIG